METDDSSCASSTSVALGKQPPDPNQANLLRAGGMSRSQHVGDSQCWRNTGTSKLALLIPFPGSLPCSESLPGHRCAIPVSTSSSSPSPASQSCSLSQSIPCHPKRLGLTHHGTHAQCRPCSLSRLCPQPSVWGHVPRGALWPTPNDRDLPALFMSLLSAQCKSCNGEHRLSCTPQPLCSPGSLSSPMSHSTPKVPTPLSLAPTISPQTCQHCGVVAGVGSPGRWENIP